MPDVLRATDWEVRRIPAHGEVVRLLRSWHYSRSAPNTSTYRHGIYPRGVLLSGDAWGVTLWIPPTRTTAEALAGDDWQGVLALSRVACAPELPQNAASFLVGRSMKMVDRRRWPVLVTYADPNEGHAGAIYKATNWREDGEVPAGDVWTSATGELRGRKRGRFTFTRAEMLERGYTPRPQTPKFRFVHDVRRVHA